jgi:hypothetical protein
VSKLYIPTIIIVCKAIYGCINDSEKKTIPVLIKERTEKLSEGNIISIKTNRDKAK